MLIKKEGVLKVSVVGELLRCYAVPAFSILLTFGILLGHGNKSVFLLFNGLAAHTGDSLWANWTLLGDGWVALVLLLPFVGRHPAMVWSAIVTALIAGIAVPLLKDIFVLPRPPAVMAMDVIHIIGPAYKSRSFPSGHTTTGFILAGILSLYFRHYWVFALSLIVAVGVGISRMAVGVHWPLDVTVGAALGWLCAVVGSYLSTRWRWGESLTGQRVIASLIFLTALWLLFYFKEYAPWAALLPKIVATSALITGTPGLMRVWRGR
jgi:membrane-associated phospholipid phosphatase